MSWAKQDDTSNRTEKTAESQEGFEVDGTFPNKAVFVYIYLRFCERHVHLSAPQCDVNLSAHPTVPTPQPKEIHAAYETNRREATEELLHLVAAAMRSVWTLNRGTTHQELGGGDLRIQPCDRME